MPPANHLEKLVGNRAGQHSIRVNRQYRVCFRWQGGLRLARYFGTSERFWTNLQANFDLETEKDRLGKRLEREVKTMPMSG